MADPHQEGTSGTSIVFHPWNLTMDMLVFMGLVFSQDMVSWPCKVTQLPELTEYHSAPKLPRKNEAALAAPQGSSFTTLKLEQQHQLLPESPAPRPSNFSCSTGSSLGPPAPPPSDLHGGSTSSSLGLQLQDRQTSIATRRTAAPLPPWSKEHLLLPWISSSTTLRREQQHQLLLGSLASPPSNLNYSSGTYLGLQLHNPQTRTATPVLSWISSSMTLRLESQHQLLTKPPAPRPSN
ncbi:uncharacterized protein LOC117097390 [Trachypithecus francoisi]|uniref:uncharacterized protein LOC117097390 n=1 Tax=Trachypithecus francoisi TaxID=54180 RepID=UPI00141B6F17|nr:uncharacterized protein LOC117097390 [Trachypithecus francoisi]